MILYTQNAMQILRELNSPLTLTRVVIKVPNQMFRHGHIANNITQ